MQNDYFRGSEWRKWDLHVHTASSYDNKYNGADANELLVNAWHSNNLAAVAITDHFIIDKVRINDLRKLAPDITIFPGVELRTDKGAANLHIIAIFHEDVDLEMLSADFDAIMLRQYAKEKDDLEKIYWDFEHIRDFVENHCGVLSIHAGNKTQGVDRVITNATPVAQAIKTEFSKYIHFYEIGKLADIKEYTEKVFPAIGEKPLILCSDNHDPRNYTIKESLWIKADPTFEGLIQCIHDPSERVFVGNIPTKLDISNKSKQSYIDIISVTKSPDAKNTMENWFDFEIPLNAGLTTIIGNKGGGKSALSDIIALFCQSHAIKYASFLNSERFKKLPKNLANDYQGTIQWLDGKVENVKTLAAIEYTSSIENAQYLPQKYIELVCNELGNEFQEEINQVIFSYVDVTEKGNARNLEELIDSRSIVIKGKTKEIQNKLDDVNDCIILAEKKLVSSYKQNLEDNYKKRLEDLERHEKNRPIEVVKPEKKQSDKYEQELASYDENIVSLEKEINNVVVNIKELNENVSELKTCKVQVQDIVNKINKLNQSLLQVADKHKLDNEIMIINYSAPTSAIDNKLNEFEKAVENQQLLLDDSDQGTDDVSLYKKLNLIKKKKMDLISQTDANEKLYQKYLSDLKAWESAKDEIIGDIAIENTIKNYEKELNYVEKILPVEYKTLKVERLSLVAELFELKKEKAKLYSEIYKPVEKELEKLLISMDDKIEFTVSITISDSQLASDLLEFISKQYSGIFYGKTESQNKMNEIISRFDFNNIDDVKGFISEVLKCIDEDLDSSSKKIKNKKEFYELLTYLDYLDAEYTLKMSGKQLKELSAGQRGIVLLIFYLALSKNEIPIIIDQPEDNLDNQSVFDKLVPCILEAKKKRQVIIVTHNPNIAIACDAEQIIYCSISKVDNKITYVSGGIENREIRKYVIDVLEGTKPAFELRKVKYSI